MRLLLILLLLPCVCSGQYYPIPTSNAVWTVYHTTFASGHFHSFSFGADTVLNGNTYHILQNDPHPFFEAIRELPNKQYEIYRNPPILDTIMLLYDFSMNLGDSMLSPNPSFPNEYLIVDSTGFIQLVTESRRFWRLHNSVIPNYSDWWIEGIGSLQGIRNPGGLMADDDNHELHCFHHDGNLIYENVLYQTCDTIPLLTKPVAELSSLTIYPNPTTGVFTVQGATGSIVVYDLFGRKVSESRLNTIDLSGQPKGLYVVRAGEAVRKLVVQ